MQANPQLPPEQLGVAFCGAVQVLLQEPQAVTVVFRFVSQPVLTLPSQLAHPALQLPMVQEPPLQSWLAFGRLQALPQAPQWLGFVLLFVSQPLSAFPSQLRNGALQTMPHLPALQPAVPLVELHCLPQLPQLPGSVATFVSQPLASTPSQFSQPGSQLLILQT